MACEYTYSIGNESGHSDEKILLTADNTPANWGESTTLHGSPGARNTMTPPVVDFAITRITVDPEYPSQGESFALTIVVTNLGLTGGSPDVELHDITIAELPVLLESWTLPSLGYQQEDSVRFETTLASGYALFQARLTDSDDRNENNSFTLTVGASGLQGLQLNEIMYRPGDGRAEWVELVNRSVNSISLDGWQFADGRGISDSTLRVDLPPVLLQPDSFLLLASDSSIFFETLPYELLLEIWNGTTPSLNNSGDSLVLIDPQGEIIERVDYRPNWGSDEAGFSLERLSSEAEVNDPTNWAASLDSTGGTPGRENSRAMGADSDHRSTLELTPNPFSPDDDGQDDILAIRYKLDHADSRLDIKIYDSRGREVKKIADNDPAGLMGEKLWDGRDKNGRLLPTGLYIVYLEALGQGGDRVLTEKRAVALVRRR